MTTFIVIFYSHYSGARYPRSSSHCEGTWPSSVSISLDNPNREYGLQLYIQMYRSLSAIFIRIGQSFGYVKYNIFSGFANQDRLLAAIENPMVKSNIVHAFIN